MNWDMIRNSVVAAIKLGTPIVATAFPGAAYALNIANHIVQGVEAAEPSAMALKNSIESGNIPTNEQLEEYAKRYNLSSEALEDDINKKIAEIDARDESRNGSALRQDEEE